MLAFIPPPVTLPQTTLTSEVQAIQALPPTIPDVPFYSQFKDIVSPLWQNVGCGITSLAMVVDFYKPDAVSVNSLLKQGIAAGAYENGVGWRYGGLIALSKKYGLSGAYYDLSTLAAGTAFDEFQNLLKDGPVILSVHNRFNPKSTVPHLVVIDGINNNVVYYNDPAAKTGEKQISVPAFLASWKEKVIALRPMGKNSASGLSLK